jgi:hypothetical protein
VDLEHGIPIFELDACGCCQTRDPARDEPGEAYGCQEKSTVLTHREEKILKHIRELSLKAKGIKAKMKQLGANSVADEAARTGLMVELEGLRRRRSQLEAERIAAAEERMRMLGHA